MDISLFIVSKSGPIDLIFGVPSTTELGSRGFDGFKKFAKQVTSSYPLSRRDTNVGIMQYGSKAEVILPLSSGISSRVVNQRLDNMRYKAGAQNVPAALRSAGSKMFTGGREKASKYFVFGAGSDSSSPQELKNAVRQLNYQGVSVMPIPIGPRAASSSLREIASVPKNDFFQPARSVASLETDIARQASSKIVPGKGMSPCLKWSDGLVKIANKD